MPGLGVSLHFGVDGLNLYLLLLTALLFPAVLACTWATPAARTALFPTLLLALQALLMGTFLAQDLVLLFVLWEAVLIPMVLLITVYGGARRRQAALGFFLYTMAGSVLFLAAVILVGVEYQQMTGRWSFALADLTRMTLGPAQQWFVFGAIVLACAVKAPLFPLHSWLPLAYGEASPAGTALMAGLMSKMGAFGLLKLALPLCPEVAAAAAPMLVTLAVASIVYGAVLALRQAQAKMLVAYGSLSHMGIIVLGIFSFQPTAAQGALFQILSHGLTVAGLFLLLGLLEQRAGTAATPGGPALADSEPALASRAPRLAVVVMLFVLASLALPLTSGFTAEFLVLMGAFTQGLAAYNTGGGAGLLVAALLAATSVVLGATYMLRLARRLLFDGSEPAKANPAVPALRDLRLREGLALAPLLALILAVGVWPAPMMAKVESAVSGLVQPVRPTSAALAQTASAQAASAYTTLARLAPAARLPAAPTTQAATGGDHGR
jgi:NADH-quinone oxidoreductase subunit M